MFSQSAAASAPAEVESTYAWFRLAACVALGTLGGVGIWSIAVALPAVQAEFGADRAGATLPSTFVMLGLVFGGVAMGRLADRFGVMLPAIIGSFALGLGYIATAYAPNLLSFAIIYGATIGFLGSAAVFGPLVTDTSYWFDRRRGIAVALCASGNYFAGAVWPPIVQHFIEEVGWRQTHIGIGIACIVLMLPLTLALRRPSPVHAPAPAAGSAAAHAFARPLGMSPMTLQMLLLLAGLSCCVAMSMPQVHIVAYCVDLGYGAARGAEMLSVMLACGVVSRLTFGLILDRIGATATLLMASSLQAFGLALYLPFDGLISLYVVSALFGLFQGGIVPTYAIIVREHFPPQEAGTRVGLVLSSTLAGMALGGWMSGAIFDLTGSYHAAVLNGIGWNFLNMMIAFWLLRRHGRPRAPAFA